MMSIDHNSGLDVYCKRVLVYDCCKHVGVQVRAKIPTRTGSLNWLISSTQIVCYDDFQFVRFNVIGLDIDDAS